MVSKSILRIAMNSIVAFAVIAVLFRSSVCRSGKLVEANNNASSDFGLRTTILTRDHISVRPLDDGNDLLYELGIKVQTRGEGAAPDRTTWAIGIAGSEESILSGNANENGMAFVPKGTYWFEMNLLEFRHEDALYSLSLNGATVLAGDADEHIEKGLTTTGKLEFGVPGSEQMKDVSQSKMSPVRAVRHKIRQASENHTYPTKDEILEVDNFDESLYQNQGGETDSKNEDHSSTAVIVLIFTIVYVMILVAFVVVVRTVLRWRSFAAMAPKSTVEGKPHVSSETSSSAGDGTQDHSSSGCTPDFMLEEESHLQDNPIPESRPSSPSVSSSHCTSTIDKEDCSIALSVSVSEAFQFYEAGSRNRIKKHNIHVFVDDSSGDEVSTRRNRFNLHQSSESRYSSDQSLDLGTHLKHMDPDGLMFDSDTYDNSQHSASGVSSSRNLTAASTSKCNTSRNHTVASSQGSTQSLESSNSSRASRCPSAESESLGKTTSKSSSDKSAFLTKMTILRQLWNESNEKPEETEETDYHGDESTVSSKSKLYPTETPNSAKQRQFQRRENRPVATVPTNVADDDAVSSFSESTASIENYLRPETVTSTSTDLNAVATGRRQSITPPTTLRGGKKTHVSITL